MLSLDGISVRRGGRLILSGVTAAFAPKTITILRAPNGGGKTTLLRALAQLLPIEKGIIDFANQEAVFCGHLDAIKSAMSVAETLQFWQAIYGTRSGAADEPIMALGLGDLMNVPASLLSAGQKRRLGLARAFIAPAQIKLFDEPTTALDRDTRAAFFDLLTDTARTGATIIMSSHDDLVPPAANSLDLSKFKPEPEAISNDPFLAEAFE